MLGLSKDTESKEFYYIVQFLLVNQLTCIGEKKYMSFLPHIVPEMWSEEDPGRMSACPTVYKEALHPVTSIVMYRIVRG